MTDVDHELLKVDGISKSYKGRSVVNGVSLTVGKGEIVGLLGPNGAGKTTSFYMVVGLIRSDSGTITFNGRNIAKMPVYKRARLGIGYLSQEPSVFRKLTVEDNIMSILQTLKISGSERRTRLVTLLKDLGLEKLAKQRAYTLSGGERRRLEISRALVTRPSILMLDEPFSGVDPLAVGDIQDIILGLRERGLGIFITDHNVRETLSVVNRAYLMFEGKIIREGESSFLVNDKLSRELYLGNSFKM
jgi:lipopolysaccharide export system ATP-binding protein